MANIFFRKMHLLMFFQKTFFLFSLSFGISLINPVPLLGNEYKDISSILMTSTFKIRDNSSYGTVFLMGKPISEKSPKHRYVLFTAKHVLKNMKGDSAILSLRHFDGETYKKLDFKIPIRLNGKPLWVNHPDVDIAAMWAAIPSLAKPHIVPIKFLATDETLEKYEIHPGDDIMVLGFPFGFSDKAGFPILRSGKISSFQLTPTSQNKTFLIDFEVFPGNSGGPVYIESKNRNYGGSTHIGIVRLILGIVIEEIQAPRILESYEETTIKKINLKLRRLSLLPI